MSVLPSLNYDDPQVAGGYASGRALTREAVNAWRSAIRVALPPQTPWPRTVLDVGCGTGRFSALLADLFDATVLGIDPAEKMLAEARRLTEDPRCTFMPGSTEALPVRDASAEVAFLSMVYHHVKDWPAALAELRRVLVSNGVVLLRIALREQIETTLWARFFPEALALDRQRIPSHDEVLATFVGGGWRLASLRPISHRFADNPEAYLAKIRRRALSNLQLIDDEAFARGLSRLEEHVRTLSPAAGPYDEDLSLYAFVQTTQSNHA